MEDVVPDSLARWMAAVASIAKALNTEKPLPAVLTEISEQTCALIGVDRCAVMQAEETGTRLLIRGHAALSADYVRRLNDGDVPLLVHPADPSSDTPAARAFRECRTVTLPDVEDTRELVPFRRLIVEQGYRAIVAAPLCSHGLPTGVLVGYSAEPRTFTAGEIELVNLFADQASLALNNAQLRDGEQRIIRELHRQHERAEWVERQDRKLMRLLVADVGLAGVVRSLADSLEASATLLDGAGRVLASVGEPLPDLEPAEAAHAQVEVKRIDLDGRPGWIAPVVLGGEVVATLWVISTHAEPDPVHGSIIERFAPMVALELLKERHATATELRLSRDLVSDLLETEGAMSEQTLLDRGKALGHDLGSAHTLVLLAVRVGDGVPGHPGPAQAFERAVSSVRASCGGPVLAGVRQTELVLLIPEDEDGLTDIAERVRADVARRLAGNEVIAVIGDTVHRLDRYQAAYRVARGAAELAGSTRPILRVADLGVWAILLESGAPAALRELADRLLAPIEEQDRKRGTGLRETLRAWLQNECSTSAAAEELVVHTNTVSYRLNRIEQLCGRSLKSHDTLLQFHIALTVRALEGS